MMPQTPSPTADIIVSGHLCLDILPQMDDIPLEILPTPGRLIEIGPLTIATGGAVSNTGLALHRLGMSVSLMSSVGDDMVGEMILRVIEARDPALRQGLRVLPGEASAYTVILSPQRVDRIFLHSAGTNENFCSDDVDFDQVAQARLFHLGYPTMMPRLTDNGGTELAAIFRRVKEAGVVTSLDMSMPDPTGASGRVDWPAVLRSALPYIDIFVPSLNEIMFMWRRADYDACGGDVLSFANAAYLDGLAGDLLELGAVVTGFKLSELGAVLYTSPDLAQLQRLKRIDLDAALWAGRREYHPAFQVEVVGTTGAGDSAYAALLAAMLRGLPPEEVIRWSCAVGACNVEAADALSGVRTWEATAARLAAGWPVSDRRLRGF